MPTTYIVYPHVVIGENPKIGEYVLIGVCPDDAEDDQMKTVIGAGAIIRSHTTIYAGNTIGRNFRTGHGTLIRESNDIGDDVSIGSHSVIEHHVKIGDGVRIHSQAFVPEWTELKPGCWIGPRVVLTNARYPRSRRVKEELRGPIIGEGAMIGANTTVLPGVTIGAGALIGAGSVVVHDVPPGMVAAGNPARLMRRVTDIAAYA